MQATLFELEKDTEYRTQDTAGKTETVSFQCVNGHQFEEPAQDDGYQAICPVCGTRKIVVS